MRRLHHRRAIFRCHQPAARQAAKLHVVPCEDCDDAHSLPGLGNSNAGNLGMGMRASQEIHMKLSGKVYVVSIAAFSGEKTKVFLAPHPSADPLISHEWPPIDARS